MSFWTGEILFLYPNKTESYSWCVFFFFFFFFFNLPICQDFGYFAVFLLNIGLIHFRLSKLTGDKLTLDNPNITDLSDPNRPTKLVEMMAELYDNEWTGAFEAFQSCKKNSDTSYLDDKKNCQDSSRHLYGN